ncbi:MAG: TatD family hydrolase [Dehalococcoidia bacterium]
MHQTFNAENHALKNPLIDGHTHIDQYGEEELDALLQRAELANIGLIISAGTTMDSCRSILLLADSVHSVRAGIGLHPADLTGWVDEKTLAELRGMAKHPKVVEWSETGLDYMPNSPAWDVQQDAFRKQIRLAKEHSLPLVIHSREAEPDTLRILREEGAGEVGGAWHYFQQGLDLAEQAMDLGFFISLAKPLLRLDDLQQVASQLPLERVVLETDSYPQPFKKYRERWTEPWHLPQVAEKVAELQGVDVEHVAQVTTANYLRMLGGRVDASELRSA